MCLEIEESRVPRVDGGVWFQHRGMAPSCSWKEWLSRKSLGLEDLPMSGMSESWVLYLSDGDVCPPAA